MKQVLQDLATGETLLAEVPQPRVAPKSVLIQTSRSLVSAGTERMLLDFGRAGWLSKARQQPEKVKQVLQKVRTDGLLPTVGAVRSKLNQPLPLGYCNVGSVTQVGPGLEGLTPGERVASNGKHAEFVSVPGNLVVPVPDSVNDDHAAFTVVGAIALQSIRLIRPTLGETVVVTGLGLIGLMVVQLLQAHGCRVVGLDFDRDRVALAESFGAKGYCLSSGVDPVAAVHLLTKGIGADAVIIAASTDSNEPISQAAQMSRKRGRIVLVGVAGLNLSRAEFYEKELSFQVSCSYGPGRYDPEYEEKGHDYPIGYVRWTEQRNMSAILDMLATRRINVDPLISHRFSLTDVESAYAVVGGSEPSLGIIFEYPQNEVGENAQTVTYRRPKAAINKRISFIGAGQYATSTLVPAFKRTGAELVTVVSAGGVSSAHIAQKFGFAKASTSTEDALADSAADAVAIVTRHNSHAALAEAALQAGKHVFVEKPLALEMRDLDALEKATALSDRILTVGFNRRYSPLVQEMKRLLDTTSGPRSLIMTVNAGQIPGEHWTQDPEVGGGRVAGEACHFIDLLRFLAGARCSQLDASYLDSANRDSVTISMRYENGSIGTVHYFAEGSKSYPKERLQVFSQGRVLDMDNFKSLTGYGWPDFKSKKLWSQDKGQEACARAFVEALETGVPPIPHEEVFEVSRLTLQAAGRA